MRSRSFFYLRRAIVSLRSIQLDFDSVSVWFGSSAKIRKILRILAEKFVSHIEKLVFSGV